MTISHIMSLNVNPHGHFSRNSLRISDDQGIFTGYNIKLSALCYKLQYETLSVVAEGIAK